MAEKKEKKHEIKLTVEELRILSQVLFNTSWNGNQWQKTVTPLINKLAKIIDQIKFLDK